MRICTVVFMLFVLAIPHILVGVVVALDKLNMPQGYTHYVGDLGYDTVQPIVDVESDQFRNIDHLNKIVIAIAKYENEKRSFPHGDKPGIQLMSAAGADDEWIDGLVPVYVDSLPQYKKKRNDLDYNFVYYSNGVDYKLLALNPGDCESVKAKYSQMVDPKRGCRAYGYWTKGARAW